MTEALPAEVDAWLRAALKLEYPCTVTVRVFAGKGGKVFRVVRLGEAEEKIVVDLQERREA